MVPSLFKGRLGWVFDRRKAAILRSASSVRNFAPTRGEGSSIYLSSEASEKVFSPFTTHISQKNPPQPSLGKGGRKAAFTLAEVLITLGIIGVVAAITMPTLIAKHQKRVFATRLKQTYSQLSQAIQSAQAEYGDSTSWTDLEYSSTSWNIANKYFLPYLKVVNPLKSLPLKDFGYNDGFLTKNPQVKYAEPNWTYSGTNLANGVNLFFGLDGPDVEDRFLIFIDVNGSAGPNVTGRDLFLFRFSPNKARLTPYGDEFTRTQLKQFCSSAVQSQNFFNFTCTALVMKDGWEFANDYPW